MAAALGGTTLDGAAASSGIAAADIGKIFEVGEETIAVEAGEVEFERVARLGVADRRLAEVAVDAPEDSAGDDVEVSRPHQTVAGDFQFFDRVRRPVVTGRLPDGFLGSWRRWRRTSRRWTRRARCGSSGSRGRRPFSGPRWRPVSKSLTLARERSETGGPVSSKRRGAGPEAGRN